MQTSPLRNGDKLPDHPDHTTALQITKYGRVFDATDGQELMPNLHRTEVGMLRGGERGGLSHLYRYHIESNHIFHTRGSVVIEVECSDAVTE